MANVSLIIKNQNSDTKKTYNTSVTYINPNASNEKLIELSRMLINLSQNNLQSVSKVTKEVIY